MSTATVQMHKVVWESGMTKHSAYSEVAESAVLALKIPTSLNLQKKILCLHPQHRTYMWETQFYLRVYIRSIQWLWGEEEQCRKAEVPEDPMADEGMDPLKLGVTILFLRKKTIPFESSETEPHLCVLRDCLSQLIMAWA